MKKITKTLVTIVCLVALCLGVFALTACGNDDKGSVAKTGEAYALTHNAGYVGYSKVTVKDNKVTDLVLTEVCFPSEVSFKGTSTTSAADALSKLPATPDGMTEDDFAVVKASSESTKDGVTTTTYTATAYYKTVTYGDVTMVYDTTAKAYKVGEKTLKEHFATEANCKAYYEAVIGNKISVKAGETTKTGLLGKTNLSKEENGYWTRQDKDGKDYSRWKWNRDNTVAYVKANGVANLSKLTKPGKDENNKQITNGKDFTDTDVAYWMDGEVSTGATWNDLNKADVTGYLTYVQLIQKAYDAAK